MKVTHWVLIVLAAALIVFDIVVYLADEPTLSVVLHDWAADYTIIPFGLGVLAGHILWPQFRNRGADIIQLTELRK